MAPKRSRGSSSAQFDAAKFVSQSTYERYRDSLLHKTPLPERGFHTNEYGIMHIINDRRWQEFTKQPGSSVTAVVREFYANAHAPRDDRVFVRGKWVCINRTTINELFGLQDIENDEYQQYLEDINYDEVISHLCAPGTLWKMGRRGEHVSFAQSALSRYGKAWHHFIAARLMPVSHVSNVIQERAVLLFAIVTGRSIDVGRIMARQIALSVKQATLGLYFPSLITEMCRRAGVVWDSTEEWVGPRRVIDRALIASYKEDEGARQLVVADRPGPSRPAGPPKEQDRWDRLDRRLDHIDSNLCSVSQMLHRIAAHTGVDLSDLPPVSAFEEEDDEDDDDEDDDDEDEDDESE